MRSIVKGLVCLLILSWPPALHAGAGDFDSSFGLDGKVTTSINKTDTVNGVAVQSDGKIVAAGVSIDDALNNYLVVARYKTDGEMDGTFGTAGIALTGIGKTDFVADVAIQPDGKIVVGGYARPSTHDNFVVVRLDSLGTPDATFGTNGVVMIDFGGTGDRAYAVAVQPDGKIVVAGDSNGDLAVARLKTDGTPDNGFDTDGRVVTHLSDENDVARAVLIQPDGMILVAGYAQIRENPIEPSIKQFALARYDSLGSLDGSFGDGGKFFSSFSEQSLAQGIALQPDGKILMTGYRGTDIALMRLLAGGIPDNSFGTNGVVTSDFGPTEGGWTIVPQPDGKIVVGGLFRNGTTVDLFAARYAGGALDATFGEGGKITIPTGLTELFKMDLALQSDGKILLAGSLVEGAGANFLLARLLSDEPESAVSEPPTPGPSDTTTPGPSDTTTPGTGGTSGPGGGATAGTAEGTTDGTRGGGAGTGTAPRASGGCTLIPDLSID